LTPVRVCRIARSARVRRQVQPRPTGRVSAALRLSAPSASLRWMYCSPPRRGARGEDGARGVCFRWRVEPCPTGPIFVRTAIIRSAPRAVGLMEIEHKSALRRVPSG